MTSTQKEYKHYLKHGYCYDLGSLAYNELVSEGKIPKKASKALKQAGIKFSKQELIKGFEVDKSIASKQMKKVWQEKIDNIDELINNAITVKGSSVIREHVYTLFKRYAINDYFERERERGVLI